MTDMDIQTEAGSVSEGRKETSEAPPMDLGDHMTPAEEGPPCNSGEDGVCFIQDQPGSPQTVPVPRNSESKFCNEAGPGEAQKGPENMEGPRWFPDPQSSNVQGVTEEISRDVARAVEELADTVALEDSTHWARGTDEDLEVGSRPQASPGVDQRMDLEEEAGEDFTEADPSQLRGLVAQLQRLQSPSFHDSAPSSEERVLPVSDSEEGEFSEEEKGPLLDPTTQTECQGRVGECAPCPLHVAMKRDLGMASRRFLRATRDWRGRGSHRLLSAEADSEDLLSLLRYEGGAPSEQKGQTPLARSNIVAGTSSQGAQDEGSSSSLEELAWPTAPLDPTLHSMDQPELEGTCWGFASGQEDPCALDPSLGAGSQESSPEPRWRAAANGSSHGREPPPVVEMATKADLSSFPAYEEVPGPCEPEDLLDGVIFGAKYLGSTQLISERTPPTSVRMAQAQEVVDRIKAPEGESQPMTEVDLFVSTQRIKVLTADSQEAMMDHPLSTISYIADIGNIVVLMARRKLPRQADVPAEKQRYKMICHVFHSADAQLIAQAIGQAFAVAYRHFLRASGIDPSQVGPRRSFDDDDALAEGEDFYNGDLAHFSKQENCKKVIIRKRKGEILGIVIVESGWGSILPTVVIANLMHGGAAETSGSLSIGDRIMSVNGTSLVGLPLGTCQNIIRDLKNQADVTLEVVHCPPVTTAIVRRPDAKYPLGFCVENGVICSLMRGGIAERGGIRVGHRLIEINGQSVVAVPHEKIIQILTEAVQEVHIKTMPASTYRLLTGQEQPVFL